MSTKIGRNDPCWCGSGKKYKKCHEAFDAKVEILRQKGYPVLDHKLIKTPEQIEKIKESCRINVADLIMWQSILKLVYQQKKSIIGYMRKLCVMEESRHR